MPHIRHLLLLFTVLCVGAALAAFGAGYPQAGRAGLRIAALPVAAFVTWDVARSLRRGVLGVDVIALLAILVALALEENLAGAIIALMVATGNALEEFAAGRARRELAALMARTPRVAHRRDGEQLTDIAVADIRPGYLLLVKPGEIVPTDGAAEAGAATLDDSALTGEALPVTRTTGQDIRSGGVNAGGPFLLRATARAEDSAYAAIVRLVRATENERPAMVRMADRWALWLLPFTALVAGGSWWFTTDPLRALAVMVVANSCPLILAPPIALLCGVSRAAKRGIIVKGGSVLERLAQVRVVLFDKTGTLTSGTPRVAGVEALAGHQPDEVLRLAASLDQMSQHSVAGAIVAAGRATGLPLSAPTEVVEIPGGGLTGIVDGLRVAVGSAGLLEQAGLTLPTEGTASRLAATAAGAAWVAVDGQPAGVLLLADRIRPEAARTIRALRLAGITRIGMVSGDRADFANAVGASLGLDSVHADLSPAGKIGIVREAAAGAVTVMVGDGINDAPALAAASIGVAMGARGAAAAAEAADVVLLVDRIDRVAEAIAIAKRTRMIALQSMTIGMGLSAMAMLAAALGYLPPVFGALLQESIDVVVILNALRGLTGSAAIVPLSAGANLARLVDDHARLRALLERMRRTADRLHTQGTESETLNQINAELRAVLLPHQQDEERTLFPELARKLGGRDPLAAMARMHDEIAHLCTRFAAIVEGLGVGSGKISLRTTETSAGELREIQRLLYVLDAVISLHLSAEEEILGQIQDLPSAATP